MVFDMSNFTDPIWGNPYDAKKTNRPTNIADALYSLSKTAWDTYARDILPGVKTPTVGDFMLVIYRANRSKRGEGYTDFYFNAYDVFSVRVYDK